MNLDRFGQEFLLPLVAGGTLHAGAPLGRAGLDALLSGRLGRTLDAQIFEARMAVARELLYDPLPTELDVDAVRLAVALHDLLFLFHPDAASTLVRSRRLLEVADYAARLAALPETIDPDRLVARHTVLHLFPSLTRTDVLLSWWVGRREFHGEEPPSRLLTWPSVRRVRQERRRIACFTEAASHPLGGPVVRALLDGSPLTDLLHPGRIEPPLRLGRRSAVLATPAVCRLVAAAHLELGLPRVAAPLSTAVLAELDGKATAAMRLACAYLAHLHLCDLLGPEAKPAPRDPRGRAAPRIPVTTDLAVRDFYGLYAALHRVRPELAAPADVRRDPRLAVRVDEYAAACARACGPARVGELIGLVARTLGGPLALAPPAASPATAPEVLV